MAQPEPPPTLDHHPTRPSHPWYLSPYLHLALNGLLVTAAELLLKRGGMATASVSVPRWIGWLGTTSLGSWWTWAGIAIYIASFLNWLHVLRWVPLSIAFPITSVVHALIPVGSWLFLSEKISLTRWGGIGLIMLGIWFVAEPMVRAEEAL